MAFIVVYDANVLVGSTLQPAVPAGQPASDHAIVRKPGLRAGALT
jgi:hypothetical protein